MNIVWRSFTVKKKKKEYRNTVNFNCENEKFLKLVIGRFDNY